MSQRFVDDALPLSFEIFGVSDDLKTTLTGIIDTGFSGYLTLPFTTAFPLGLILKGEQSHTLANGRTSSHFLCLGTVSFGGNQAVVPIDVQPEGPILIGVQLLAKLGVTLNVNFPASEFSVNVSPLAQPATKPLSPGVLSRVRRHGVKGVKLHF